MPVMESIKNTAYRLFAPDPPGLMVHQLKGVPGNVERVMDETLDAGRAKLWRGLVHSIGSGLGKGVVIAATIVIVGTGLGELAGLGFAAGAASGFFLLFSGTGAIWLGVGALLGSIMEIHQNQNKISAEIAKVEAKNFETLRTQLQTERSQAIADSPAVNFTARELAKRDAPQQALGK